MGWFYAHEDMHIYAALEEQIEWQKRWTDTAPALGVDSDAVHCARVIVVSSGAKSQRDSFPVHRHKWARERTPGPGTPCTRRYAYTNDVARKPGIRYFFPEHMRGEKDQKE